MDKINWYPGHMKKTRELIESNLKMVDLAVEIIDARIPVSSRNPVILKITERKPRLIVLNKSDLADPEENRRWIRALKKENVWAIEMNSLNGQGTKNFLAELEKIRGTLQKDLSRRKPLRMMVVGVPNVGKSSFINRLTGRKAAKTGDRPGVTRGKQWLTLQNGMQLLDTPGILWPKLESPETGLNLAFCGSIKEEILVLQDLGFELIRVLRDRYPDLMMARYGLNDLGQEPLDTMDLIARKRGAIKRGNEIDYDRCAKIVLDDFRSGKIGRITLEGAPREGGEE